MAAVGRGEQTLVEDQLLGRPGRDDPPIDQGRLLEPMGRTGQVMGGGHDGLAGPGLGLQDVHQVLLGRGVDAGDRLVEEIQLRFRGQGPGEEDPPSLAARQRPDLAVDLGVHPDGLEAPRPRDGRGGPVADRPDPGVAAHHHDLADGHRELPVDDLGLGHVGHLVSMDAGSRSEDLDRPGPGCQESRDRLEQGALARAVRPDDGQQRAGRDGQVDGLEGQPVAVSGADAGQADRRPARPGSGGRTGLDRRGRRGREGVGRARHRGDDSASTTRSTFQRMSPR